MTASLWEFMNSPAGITLIGTVCAYLLAWFVKKKPEYAELHDRYFGAALRGVQWAEKLKLGAEGNPAWMRKAEEARAFVAKVFESIEGRMPTEREDAILAGVIEEAYTELEEGGHLARA